MMLTYFIKTLIEIKYLNSVYCLSNLYNFNKVNGFGRVVK